VHLGPTEFRLLQYLMEAPRARFFLGREELLNGVWGPDIYGPSPAHGGCAHSVACARRSTQAIAPDVIRTVRAAGYSLDANGESGLSARRFAA